ncbi:hypothetical protein BGZ58_010422, partial [Dissophora ornata]
MTGGAYFETGKHHILCKARLDPIEFPYPKEFQDSWDNDHVRLPCSEKPSSSSSSSSSSASSRWSEIVQGLTTPINNSEQLSEIMARWNGGDYCQWNAEVLKLFIDQKANRTMHHARRRKGGLGRTTGGLSDAENSGLQGSGEEELDSDIDEDALLDETSARFKAMGSGDDDVEVDEADFLNNEERERFFKVILPNMQELALRLPELVKKPIPFLKQQQDSAITLSQEQIACLLANAFFNTFPNRNSSARRPNKSNDDDDVKSKKRQHPGSESGHMDGEAGGRTIGKSPKDIHGAASRLKSKVEHLRDPLRNANGQLSLFAYFGKKDPKNSIGAAPPSAAKNETLGSRITSPIDVDKRQKSSDNSKKEDKEKEMEKQMQQVKDDFARYPSINFWTLFHSEDLRAPAYCTPPIAAKLRLPQGAVTYHRQVLQTPISLEQDERISKEEFCYVKVRVDVDSPLEDEAPPGALQLDFANKVIGGGVLGHGAVQEEIRFAICPELIISRLFTQNLQENETVLIKGAERYSSYNGYGYTFTWHSDFIDETPRDHLGRRKTEICAIDALPFGSKDQRLSQFSKRNVLRELNKAIVGFRRSPITCSEWGLCRAERPNTDVPAVATGNWGCGAFGGHLHLKFLIQLLAASVCGGYSFEDQSDGLPLGRDIVYYSYGLDDLGREIDTFMSHLHARQDLFEP